MMSSISYVLPWRLLPAADHPIHIAEMPQTAFAK
jgi:hypothetical protein